MIINFCQISVSNLPDIDHKWRIHEALFRFQYMAGSDIRNKSMNHLLPQRLPRCSCNTALRQFQYSTIKYRNVKVLYDQEIQIFLNDKIKIITLVIGKFYQPHQKALEEVVEWQSSRDFVLDDRIALKLMNWLMIEIDDWTWLQRQTMSFDCK